jgi:hypothetical protein
MGQLLRPESGGSDLAEAVANTISGCENVNAARARSPPVMDRIPLSPPARHADHIMRKIVPDGGGV